MDAHFHVRHFSLREANALVPVLQRTFAQARTLQAKLAPVQKQLEEHGLPSEPEEIDVDPAQPPILRELQARGRELGQSLLSALSEVSQLGIEVKAADGLCDFRTRLGGRTVYLCWRFGEERITHYHDLASGYAGRKPLPDGADFVGELLH
jgi:hypothetical protein